MTGNTDSATMNIMHQHILHYTNISQPLISQNMFNTLGVSFKVTFVVSFFTMLKDHLFSQAFDVCWLQIQESSFQIRCEPRICLNKWLLSLVPGHGFRQITPSVTRPGRRYASIYQQAGVPMPWGKPRCWSFQWAWNPISSRCKFWHEWKTNSKGW